MVCQEHKGCSCIWRLDPTSTICYPYQTHQHCGQQVCVILVDLLVSSHSHLAFNWIPVVELNPCSCFVKFTGSYQPYESSYVTDTNLAPAYESQALLHSSHSSNSSDTLECSVWQPFITWTVRHCLTQISEGISIILIDCFRLSESKTSRFSPFLYDNLFSTKSKVVIGIDGLLVATLLSSMGVNDCWFQRDTQIIWHNPHWSNVGKVCGAWGFQSDSTIWKSLLADLVCLLNGGALNYYTMCYLPW